MKYTDPSEMPSFYEDMEYTPDVHMGKMESEKSYCEKIFAELLSSLYGQKDFQEENVEDLLEELRCYFDVPHHEGPLKICRKDLCTMK